MVIALVITVSFVLHLALYTICNSYYQRAEYEIKRAEKMLNEVLRREARIRRHLEDISNNQINNK